MSCNFCHWWEQPQDSDGYTSWLSKTGTCSRYPSSIETDFDHFCGEFFLGRETANGRSKILKIEEARYRWALSCQREEKAKIKAQKRVKVLNAKIRELKSQNKGS